MQNNVSIELLYVSSIHSISRSLIIKFLGFINSDDIQAASSKTEGDKEEVQTSSPRDSTSSSLWYCGHTVSNLPGSTPSTSSLLWAPSIENQKPAPPPVEGNVGESEMVGKLPRCIQHFQG